MVSDARSSIAGARDCSTSLSSSASRSSQSRFSARQANTQLSSAPEVSWPAISSLMASLRMARALRWWCSTSIDTRSPRSPSARCSARSTRPTTSRSITYMAQRLRRFAGSGSQSGRVMGDVGSRNAVSDSTCSACSISGPLAGGAAPNSVVTAMSRVSRAIAASVSIATPPVSSPLVVKPGDERGRVLHGHPAVVDEATRLERGQHLPAALAPFLTFGQQQAVAVLLRHHVGQLAEADEGRPLVRQQRLDWIGVGQDPRPVGTEPEQHAVAVTGAEVLIERQLGKVSDPAERQPEPLITH